MEKGQHFRATDFKFGINIKGMMGVAELAKIATPPPLPSCLSFLEIRFKPGNFSRLVG